MHSLTFSAEKRNTNRTHGRRL